MPSLCRQSQSNLSSQARGKPTTFRARKTLSFQVSPGKNSTPSNWRKTPFRSKWTCRKRIRSGFTLERTPQMQKPNSQRILQSQGTIPRATSWTQYPNQHLHHRPDIHTLLHTLHQVSTKMLSTPPELPVAPLCRIPILGRRSRTSTSLVVELKVIVLRLTRRRIEINKSFCKILCHTMHSAQIPDGHRQASDLRDHIQSIVHLLAIALLH